MEYRNKGSLARVIARVDRFDIYVRKAKRPKWIKIRTSKAHRRKKHERRKTDVDTSKPFRIKTYWRRNRSTEKQIKKRGGTLKQIRSRRKGKNR